MDVEPSLLLLVLFYFSDKLITKERILCEIFSSHSNVAEDGILLGCYDALISRVSKVYSTLQQTTKSQRGSRDLALLSP